MPATIFELIDDGDLEELQALLAHDPSTAAARDERGLSALMRAFYRGGGETFEAIRAADPPVDAWDRLILGESEGLPAPGDHSPDGFTATARSSSCCSRAARTPARRRPTGGGPRTSPRTTRSARCSPGTRRLPSRRQA